jgi:hypothetical protein
LRTNQQVNESFGNNILSDYKFETILFQNINGIKDETNWKQIIHTMKELNIDRFGFAETNKSMNDYSKQRWTGIVQKQFYFSRSIHSESIKFDMDYKPGGTLTTVTGKWQARISEMGQDRRRLSRWSYVKLSSKKSNLIIYPKTLNQINIPTYQNKSKSGNLSRNNRNSRDLSNKET